MTKLSLPIDPLLPQIVGYIQHNTISIVQAEPGAGKTTRVPGALLKVFPGQIYVLEPRRLAARLAARHVSEELGERVGATVGYQVRFEQVGGSQTRLWYVTEGVLTRKLLSDRQPRDVSVVILDEFHERHLETDLALALLRDLQRRRRDLRLVLMSATLHGQELAAQLGGAVIIQAPGRMFPVDIRYKPYSSEPLEQQVASAVGEAAMATAGHVLVFLPGAAEIRRAIQACEPVARQTGARVLPLHGDLRPEQQDEAVAPSRVRKIICSTNVAESSVTIDGVSAIVDSGLARVLTHSWWSGLSRLEVKKVSQASAIQRSGRAGRTGPGIAIRLYSESDFVRRPKELYPEILHSDLTPTILQLAASGLHWKELPWLDTPPNALVAGAEAMLQRLGALDEGLQITQQGRSMAALPVAPRLARFVIAATAMGARQEACEITARLSEGRLRFDAERDSPIHSDIEAILASDLDYVGRRVREQLLKSPLVDQALSTNEHAIEKAFLLAYPDRVARRRGDTLLLCDGNSAQLDRSSSARSDFVVAIEAEERSGEGVAFVRIASHIEPDWLLEYFPDRLETCEELSWNRGAERVEQLSFFRYDKLKIDETRSVPRDRDAVADLLCAKAMEAGIARFADIEELNRFLRRVRFAHQHAPDLNIRADPVAAALRQIATGLSSFAELRDAARGGGLISAIEAGLPMRQINEIAPTHVILPSGRRAKIEYNEGQPPSVASRLQDFFGMTQSPSVARGSVPLVVQLLAPNRRPVQVTTDLPSFWKNLYPQLRRELGRRYPKHAWPENPKLIVRE
ncbi:MAG TPA: ATP-dependent helicase HrpB [Bryobacteraceae bacterium]|nr:ATP-dependent helicase HrpB [Bryobacteraceae bacterium]